MFEFDLADRVDDLICVFDTHRDTEMDTISMLLTAWIIFFFVAVGLTKWLYRHFILSKTGGDSTTTSTLKDSITTTLLDAVKTKSSSDSSSTATSETNKKSASTPASSSSLSEHILKTTSDKNKGPCNGPDCVVVEYVNRCYEWLYSPQTLQQREWQDVRENFIDSINKLLREDEKTNPVVASVVDIIFKEEMALSNCFAECEHENNVKVTCDCETKMTGVLSLYSPEKGTSRFDFFVDRLCGRLNILLDCEEESAIVKFDGWPEIAIAIGTAKKSSVLDSKISESIAEKLTAAIRNAVFEVELKRFKDFPKAPHMSPKKKTQDAFKSYLVLKVIRGIDIGLQKGCEEPYCAIELDDPPQKFQTDCQSGRNPYWGENFVFNILPSGGEILFEIFDRVGTRFLGCNIVSIDEIGKEKSQTLPLKSRRMEISEQITGSVEVQFTFLDEKEFLQKSREIIEKISPNGNLIKTTKTTFTNQPSAQSEVFAEKVIKEFERNAIPNPNKSTLIIHAVQRVEKKSDGRCVEVNVTDEISSTVKVQLELERAIIDSNPVPVGKGLEKDACVELEGKKDGTGESDTVLEGQYGEERGRRRTRRGDIFTSIRRRFSKTRSRSVNPDVNPDGVEESSAVPETREHDSFARSVSVDRESLLSGRTLSILGPHSTRSSASELSGLSGHSTTTFIHENSTLVIEAIENRIRKYYLVPPHLAETGKWKKRGKKLHIFNDHTFVAKHIQSGTLCEVCNSRFPFSLGKQGYQCRDCKMKCHKECHVRTPNYCSNTTVYDIELGTTTAKCVPPTNTFSGVCSSIFSKKDSSAKVNGKDCMGKNSGDKNNSCNLTTTSSTTSKILKTNTRNKKSSIFRKVTKLGKISEENLSGSKGSRPEINSTSSQQDNGDIMEEKSIELVSKVTEESAKKTLDQNNGSGDSSTTTVNSKTLDVDGSEIGKTNGGSADKNGEQSIPNGTCDVVEKRDDDDVFESGQITQVQMETVTTTSVHLTRSPKTDNLNLAAK